MPSLRRIRVKGLLLTAAILSLICSSDAITRRPRARAEIKRTANPGTEARMAIPPSASSGPAPQATPQKAVGQLLRVFVWGTAIYPSTAHVKSGLVKLRLENQTAADVSIIVTDPRSGTAQPLASLGTAGKAIRTEQVVQLPPGEYVFYEQNHTTVKGRLIVEAP